MFIQMWHFGDKNPRSATLTGIKVYSRRSAALNISLSRQIVLALKAIELTFIHLIHFWIFNGEFNAESSAFFFIFQDKDKGVTVMHYRSIIEVNLFSECRQPLCQSLLRCVAKMLK